MTILLNLLRLDTEKEGRKEEEDTRIHRMRYLFILFFILSVFSQHCVKNHHDWLRNVSEINTTERICGLKLVDLLRVNTLNMIEPQNRAWLLSAQQYITARLNLVLFPANSNTSVEEDCLFLGDQLRGVCNNVSQWFMTESLSQSIVRLYQFNQGLLGPPACPWSHNSSNSTENQTFYYHQSPDTIALLKPDNSTFIYSVEPGFYRTQLFLIIALISGLVLLAFAGLFIVMLRNKKKRFRVKIKEEDIHGKPFPTYNPDNIASDDL